MKSQKDYIKQFAHDVLSPLNSMQIATDELHKQVSDKKELDEVLELLRLSTSRFQKLTEYFLKALDDKTEVKQDYFNINEVIEELVCEYENCYKSSLNINAKFHSDSLVVFGSKIRFQQAINNIIKNAVEAMSSNGTLNIRTSFLNQKVVVTIQDSGRGIAEEQLTQIFEEGYTINKVNGHGIGLKIVKDVVDEFNGDLKVYSKKGQGTFFYLMLPTRPEVRVVIKQSEKKKNICPVFYHAKQKQEKKKQVFGGLDHVLLDDDVTKQVWVSY